METKSIRKHINRLLLDPNNYRFIDRPEYKQVAEGMIADERVQQRTSLFLRGKNNENIDDLINSFKTNGILQQDPIQVRAIGENYLVIEGNRRTVTLKYLYEQYKQGFDVGVLTESDFKSIEVIELQSQDRRHELIAMGLNHISGKKRWSPINQTRLIRDLLLECKMSEEDVCNTLGITKHYLRRSIRTLSLIERYKNSDFGDQFQTDKYSIFEEIIKNTAVKAWLEWDDAVGSKRLDREERLFSWISSTESINRDEDFSGGETIVRLEPIINKSHEIRELAKFINDEKAVLQMEENRSVTLGFASSDAVGETRLHNALSNISQEVDIALKFSSHLSDDDYVNIGRLKTKLEMMLSPSSGPIGLLKSNVLARYNNIQDQYSSITIESYRRLKNIKITNLRNVNLFVGENNTGKTTLLEAVYLLAQLNDLHAFLELERFRGKFYKDLNTQWIEKNFLSDIVVEGEFNRELTQVHFYKEEVTDNIDRAGYVTTIKVDASVGSEDLSSYVHLYSGKEPELYYQKAQKLCQSAFSSPYRYNNSILNEAHAYAVREKKLDSVIKFINDYIDRSILKIEMVEIHGTNRFFVTSDSLENSIDITKYGEGLQRIYEIALMIIYCSNGILCIDEVDSAIHKRLLKPFIHFICKLAEDANVQLFVTTHSKECIDAFSTIPANKLMAYVLSSDKNQSVDYRYISGEDLNQMISLINIDIR